MQLNIISLDNPFPPNYGGAIDIYYKLKSLSELGCEIYLHYFYSNRSPSLELEKFCNKVSYYQRKPFIKSIFSPSIPYVVASRDSNKLVTNLSKNDYPIFYDGLQSTLASKTKELKSRKKYLRLHNIESDYMKKLSQAESSLLRKIGLKFDSFKFEKFEKKLCHFEAIFTISENDQNFYKNVYKNVYLLNVFHGQTKIKSKLGKGNYIFYHGNFDVSENIKAALFLIKNVFNKLNYPIKIAGKSAIKKLQPHNNNLNIEIIDNPDLILMEQLIKDAHIIVLPTFQATGVKLKLINSLFLGRHCIVNNKMISPTPQLKRLCEVSRSAEEFKNKITELMKIPFSEEKRMERKRIFGKSYSDLENGKILKKHIFDEQ